MSFCPEKEHFLDSLEVSHCVWARRVHKGKVGGDGGLHRKLDLHKAMKGEARDKKRDEVAQEWGEAEMWSRALVWKTWEIVVWFQGGAVLLEGHAFWDWQWPRALTHKLLRSDGRPSLGSF
jgi:hypothetical protein